MQFEEICRHDTVVDRRRAGLLFLCLRRTRCGGGDRGREKLRRDRARARRALSSRERPSRSGQRCVHRRVVRADSPRRALRCPARRERHRTRASRSGGPWRCRAVHVCARPPRRVERRCASRAGRLRADYRRLARANPEVAPYGAAAVTVLERLHLRGSTQARWVMGENVAQTLQFIATGNAELGFVARAQVIGLPSARAGSYCEVDEALYPPISQQALLLKRGAGNAAAEGFVRYLRGAAGAAVIKAAGYGVPIVQ